MTNESNEWATYGLRGMPAMSGRTKPDTMSPMLTALLGDFQAEIAKPLLGVTTDGSARQGLFPIRSTGVSTAPLLDAATAFLASLNESERDAAVFPVDAAERRMWFNIHPNVLRHGVMLEDLAAGPRAAALALLEATLSARGYAQARDIMRLNGLLVELTNSHDQFGEWPYWLSIFGSPASDRPWGWQIDGHHLNLNAMVIGDRVVLTPSFMGSEPCHVHHGSLAGTEVMVAEELAGVALIRSLDADQVTTAVLYPSILPADLPPHMQHPIDGRMMAGAFKDNAVIGYAGVPGSALSGVQRGLLRNLIGTYVGWARDADAAVTIAEIDTHIPDTYFSWMGPAQGDGPFYYRVHSPVVLIEFDQHPGVVFDNVVPSRNHIHSIIRTPNGGDYGADLLRQHHARFDHRNGAHDAR